MTTHDRDKVIAAAKEAGIAHSTWDNQDENAVCDFYAIAFEAGRQAEREECAKLCERRVLNDQSREDIESKTVQQQSAK